MKEPRKLIKEEPGQPNKPTLQERPTKEQKDEGQPRK